MNPGCKATRKFAARAEKMKNLRSAMLVFVLLFVTVASVCALDPSRHISQYAHTAWRTQDGFFSAPNAITQTADGYIWIGTLNGLVRFDGIRFVSWTAPKGQSLPDTRITSILGARDGSLWIGTVSGISRLKDGEVVNYSSMTAGISTIIEDHAGDNLAHSLSRFGRERAVMRGWQVKNSSVMERPMAFQLTMASV